MVPSSAIRTLASMRDTTVWLLIALMAVYVVLAVGAIWEATWPGRRNEVDDGDFSDGDPAHSYRLPA